MSSIAITRTSSTTLLHCTGKTVNCSALLLEIAKPQADIPADFANSDLFLTPKGTGKLTPDRFRPISVTDSIYRLLVRYWSQEFKETAARHVSPAQRALLDERWIDECVVKTSMSDSNGFPTDN